MKHTGDAILRASKQQLAGYEVGQYEYSFTASGNEIVLVDTVFPCRTSRKTSNSSMMKAQTGNASSLRWVGGCRGGGCHMT